MYEEQTQEAKQIFSEVMLKSLQKAKDVYLEKNCLNEKFVFIDLHVLRDEEVSLGFDDLIKEVNVLSKSLEADIKEFVYVSYDYGYFVPKFERFIDLEKVRTTLKEELVLQLSNTVPYGYVSSQYWYSKVQRVQSISELGKYVDDNLEAFVIKYAEDWESQTEM
ncbi:hypothetical protein P0E66_11340 [Enterococcus faecalis]|uniref:hypothetical protein n=1 Tax=Enterococcus faecalis TaxID=1351 RepID=UPI0025B0E6B2|nr:hypothetical protein [Enterococcus faecalis]MDN3201720.1 hypothetical protein [Enterococcus faecalis]